MDDFGDVTAEISSNGVAQIELHRPPFNHFDEPLLAQIADAVTSVHAGGARVGVLCSEGRHFCAGLDFSTTPSPSDQTIRALYAHALTLYDSPIPLVAAVQGAAVGGGLGLALVADFRACAPTSRLSANFARLGFHQGFGLSLTLPRAVGNQHALDLLTTGRRVEGTEAVRIGLCDVLDVDPRAAARRVAETIASSAPLAVQSIRRTLRAGMVEAFAAAVEVERVEQLRLMETADFSEGVGAARGRRTPRFTGR
ncbi:MAG: enoyl-CoA hydratase/isomerase family protein [Acidimicrobiales bacterium]